MQASHCAKCLQGMKGMNGHPTFKQLDASSFFRAYDAL